MATGKFTVAQAPVLASTYLGIQLPTSMEDLKKAYRKKSLKLHPDIRGGCREKFQEILDAYEFIVSIAHLPGIIEDMRPNGPVSKPIDRFTTTDGTSIFDLGMGLGPTRNGKDCPRCQHKGYTVNPKFGSVPCTSCDEHGMAIQPQIRFCRYCHGIGRFRQRTGRFALCNACKGTGLFAQNERGRCQECFGTKRKRGMTGEEEYERCYECKGTGEIEIHNPVIVKGRLF